MNQSSPADAPSAQREEALFRAALEQEAGPARAAFLDQACAGEPALRERLDSLLQAHESVEPFLEPVVEREQPRTIRLEPAEEEGVGTRIGRYTLLEKLGEGGFGAVWAAEQKEPMRRRVALKIIKLGMDTKQVVAR